MAKPLKIVLLVLGGIVLLVVAALVAAVLLFDPNDYRGRIQDAACTSYMAMGASADCRAARPSIHC